MHYLRLLLLVCFLAALAAVTLPGSRFVPGQASPEEDGEFPERAFRFQWSPLGWEELWYSLNPDFPGYWQLQGLRRASEPAPGWRLVETAESSDGVFLVLRPPFSVSEACVGQPEIRNLAQAVEGVRVRGLRVVVGDSFGLEGFAAFRAFRGLKKLQVDECEEEPAAEWKKERRRLAETEHGGASGGEDREYAFATEALGNLDELVALRSNLVFSKGEFSAVLVSLPVSLERLAVHCSGHTLSAISDLTPDASPSLDALEVWIRQPDLAFDEQGLSHEPEGEGGDILLQGSRHFVLKMGNWRLDVLKRLRFAEEVESVHFRYPRIVHGAGEQGMRPALTKEAIQAFSEMAQHAGDCSIAVIGVRASGGIDIAAEISSSVPGVTLIEL